MTAKTALYGLRREVNIYACSQCCLNILFLLYSTHKRLFCLIHRSKDKQEGWLSPTERASVSAINLKARSDQACRRASTRPIKLMLKIGSIHTERVDVDAHQLICINQLTDVSLSYT